MQVRFALASAAVFCFAACSPINANREISAAEGALEAAKEAGAGRYAVYEYTAAAEYLHKAHEENNYSDYNAARTYAAHARELAQEARARAEREHGLAPAATPSSMEPETPDHPRVTEPESSTAAAVEDLPQDEVIQAKTRGRAR